MISQLLSMALPATPSRFPVRSGRVWKGAPDGTTIAPRAEEKGAKLQSAPEARSRATHSQSWTMRSTLPACSATCEAGELANS